MQKLIIHIDLHINIHNMVARIMQNGLWSVSRGFFYSYSSTAEYIARQIGMILFVYDSWMSQSATIPFIHFVSET